jgi:hypothetical protein
MFGQYRVGHIRVPMLRHAPNGRLNVYLSVVISDTNRFHVDQVEVDGPGFCCRGQSNVDSDSSLPIRLTASVRRRVLVVFVI